MIRSKIEQCFAILEEKGIDMWLIFCRESEAFADPSLDLVVGSGCTWQSAFIFTRSGKATAIVGNLDQAHVEGLGHFDEVKGYVTGIGDTLRAAFRDIDPKSFAINTSVNDYMSDGLTHGMYGLLMQYLEGTPYGDRWISSEGLMAALRGRKTRTELDRIAAAVDLTEDIYSRVTGILKPGMTEKEVAAFILGEVKKEGVVTAWEREMCPAVFTGPDSAGAHCGPTDRVIERGHIMNIDFGVKKDDFCSDIQRTWYFLREGETEAPEVVRSAFNTIIEAINVTAETIRPGMTGLEVDTLCREYITSRGYEEYPHATGHQVGRSTHDGAAILAPAWERYGEVPSMKIEEGQVYTIEPRIPVPGHGVATMEEIIAVTADGSEWLSRPQTGLFYVS
jgi:Xaa-Pro aminopeptidase